MYEQTSKGTIYYWELAGSQGASFIVFANGKEYQQAKAEIIRNRDVVHIRRANQYDYYCKFRQEVFADELTQSLQWWQIDFDENDWRMDMNVKEFINNNIEKWKSIKTNPYSYE